MKKSLLIDIYYLIVDFYEAGNFGGVQGNFIDYYSQFDENY